MGTFSTRNETVQIQWLLVLIITVGFLFIIDNDTLLPPSNYIFILRNEFYFQGA